mmetsp:Transcript_24254/g.38111  ORF Transcript_24254/g.38111 Transcript_24254/m.38111 type:complete len:425 (-) Transcript_24254:1048-2322(-)
MELLSDQSMTKASNREADTASDDSIDQPVNLRDGGAKADQIEADFLLKENQRLRDSLNERDVKIARMTQQLVANQNTSNSSPTTQWQDLARPRVARNSEELSAEFAKMKERAAQAEERARYAVQNQEILQETLHLHRKRITKLYKKLERSESESKQRIGEMESLKRKVAELERLLEDKDLEKLGMARDLSEEKLANRELRKQYETMKEANQWRTLTLEKSTLTSPLPQKSSSPSRDSEQLHTPKIGQSSGGRLRWETHLKGTPGFSAIKPAASSVIREPDFEQTIDPAYSHGLVSGSSSLSISHHQKTVADSRSPNRDWKDVSALPDGENPEFNKRVRLARVANDTEHNGFASVVSAAAETDENFHADFKVRSPIGTTFSPKTGDGGVSEVLRRFEMEQASFRAEMEALKRLVGQHDVHHDAPS